jgi:hypothetical protein
LAAVSQLKALTAALGVPRTLLAGAAVFALGSATILLLPGSLNGVMYGAAAALGVGLAAITVSVATLQSTLLGSDTRSAGFVFGSMSALDKLVVGVVVLGVQIASDAPGVNLADFFRFTLGLTPLAAVGVCTLLAFSISAGNDSNSSSSSSSSSKSSEEALQEPSATSSVVSPNPLALVVGAGNSGAPAAADAAGEEEGGGAVQRHV